MKGYKKFTDEQLITLLKSGDQSALAELHDRYYAELYILAYKRFPYREEIRDILQELFTYLWHHREELTVTDGLSAYLFSSVRNRLFKIYRHQKVKDQYLFSLQTFIDHEPTNIYNIVEHKELLAIISDEIAALPPQMRLIFELSRNEELSHNEIALRLGLSPHTVRTQIRSALRILRSKLGANIILVIF